jgi:molybdopterin-guanine dinucleotide biosynthesis protein
MHYDGCREAEEQAYLEKQIKDTFKVDTTNSDAIVNETKQQIAKVRKAHREIKESQKKFLQAKKDLALLLSFKHRIPELEIIADAYEVSSLKETL